jgi:hypothetical protein
MAHSTNRIKSKDRRIRIVVFLLVSFSLLLSGCKILEPIGSIEVKSTPTGAHVVLDGSVTGETTDCILENVKEGEHAVSLTKGGYANWDTTVSVVQNKLTMINIALQNTSRGSIQVNSTPVGATIWLDSVNTNSVTNHLLINVPAGNHTIQLLKNGYVTWQQAVTVNRRQTATVNATLTPASGSLEIISFPTGAAIYLDGLNTGQVTNYLFTDVPVGIHALKLTKTGYMDWDTITTIYQDTKTVWFDTLIPAPNTPTNLALTPGVDGISVILTWKASVSQVDGYYIYFSSTPGTETSGCYLGASIGTSFTHTDPSRVGYYHVRSHTGTMVGYPSNVVDDLPVVSSSNAIIHEYEGFAPAGYGWSSSGLGTDYPWSPNSQADIFLWGGVTAPGIDPMWIASAAENPWNGSRQTGIADVGSAAFDDQTLAPTAGSGTYIASADAIVGHVYFLQSCDGNFIKIRVETITGTYPNRTLDFKYSYQKLPGLRLF